MGSADTVGGADTVGSADSVGGGRAVGTADGITRSHSESHSWASTTGSADTTGQADSRSQNWGQSHTEGDALGMAISRSGAAAVSGGFSAGLVPGISINRSWQTEDDVADRVTEVLRQLEGLLNVASAEGGFMTDALLFTASDSGSTAAEALVPAISVAPRQVPLMAAEDFSYFLKARPGAFAFLGAGEDRPALHASDYDFNDEILGPGAAFLSRLAETALVRPASRPAPLPVAVRRLPEGMERC